MRGPFATLVSLVALALTAGCGHPGQILEPLPVRPLLAERTAPGGRLPPGDQGEPAATTILAVTSGRNGSPAARSGHSQVDNYRWTTAVAVCYLRSGHRRRMQVHNTGGIAS